MPGARMSNAYVICILRDEPLHHAYIHNVACEPCIMCISELSNKENKTNRSLQVEEFKLLLGKA